MTVTLDSSFRVCENGRVSDERMAAYNTRIADLGVGELTIRPEDSRSYRYHTERIYDGVASDGRSVVIEHFFDRDRVTGEPTRTTFVIFIEVRP